MSRSEAITAAKVDAILLGFHQNMRRAGLTNPENHHACTKCLQAQIIAELALLEAEIRQKERQKNREDVAKTAEEFAHLLRRVSGV